MPDLNIQRAHELGLPEARRVAHAWARKATEKFGMECAYAEGAEEDTLTFSRPGVQGTLQVDAQQFALTAQLGFLFGAFKERIEAEIGAQLDKLLATPAPAAGGAGTAAAAAMPAPGRKRASRSATTAAASTPSPAPRGAKP